MKGGGKGEAGKNYGVPTVQKGARGPVTLQMFYFLDSAIICRPCNLTLSDQA